ncbi:MAG: hypothetical protein LBJ25_00740 [Candidatus Margulisbacteria bacterium]|jgi:microcystin-dependent protein|nr:hypothetical protein [Candidatus Margulisiibacteriota bacterium]
MTIASGEKMYADDILNLLFFPKGAILMYDGTSWQDNVTLKGWYQCSKNSDGTAKIVNGYTVPDLQDKFIMGHSGGGRAGGNNSLELSISNLPTHGHSLNDMSVSGLSMIPGGAHQHSGSGTTNSGSGGHAHTVSGTAESNGAHTHKYSVINPLYSNGNLYDNEYFYQAIAGGAIETTSDGAHTHSITGSTSENGGTHAHDVAVSIPESGSHTHAISGGVISGSVGNTGSGTPLDNRPSYYTLIYVVKVTNAGI